MRLFLFLTVLAGLFFSCSQRNKPATILPPATAPAEALTIAFGSCSNQDKNQKLWDEVLSERPDYWIWLGDNIYGDTEDMSVMRQKYNQQKSNPQYQQLRQQATILGIWDDHDYGVNDGGKEYPKRAESQQELLDFLDVPADDVRRNRPGVYTDYDVEYEGLSIKIILLDTRFFRDPLVKKDGENAPNMGGTVLGDAQWQWLANTLADSDADIHIIASSIQVIPEEHRFEKWANFPRERERLFDLLVENDIQHPIFISGDRHVGEFSQLNWKGKILYDLTSSSLTHGWSNRREEANRHRKGPLVYNENYGIIKITKDKILAYLRSDNGQEEMSLALK